jgi:hypothetical protein
MLFRCSFARLTRMEEVTARAGPQSWSDIPQGLAGLVLRLLPAYADRARFAAVCPQWRAAARQLPLPPPLPLLAFPDGTFYSLPYGKPFRFPGFGCAGSRLQGRRLWQVARLPARQRLLLGRRRPLPHRGYPDAACSVSHPAPSLKCSCHIC